MKEISGYYLQHPPTAPSRKHLGQPTTDEHYIAVVDHIILRKGSGLYNYQSVPYSFENNFIISIPVKTFTNYLIIPSF